jgi:prolyl-tRNA synthetase
MRQSQLFARTSREVSREEVSINAQLLTRGGFINRLMAGVYSFLPLGVRVLNKIENIIRDELNAMGALEILMPALQPKDIWEKTGRWDKVGVLFKFKGQGERELTLGPTHEEVVTPLVSSFIRSYRDLPVAVYQIQTKFRDEPRAKSGLLRGREFRMKDMYSFHTTQADLDQFYDRTIEAYKAIFRRCGLGATTLLTVASGGVFSKYSHEFQTVTPFGEDIIYRVPGMDLAINREIIGDESAVSDLLGKQQSISKDSLEEVKAIEVGNIFKLGTRFPDAFGASFSDEHGTPKQIFMGCYGIGPSRIMGTIAECMSDANGLIWPTEVAPFRVHLLSLARDEAERAECEKVFTLLASRGIEVLYDDREGIQAGEKFKDSDLLGLPHRLVVSKKTIAQGGVEWKPRVSSSPQVVSVERALDEIARH